MSLVTIGTILYVDNVVVIGTSETQVNEKIRIANEALLNEVRPGRKHFWRIRQGVSKDMEKIVRVTPDLPPHWPQETSGQQAAPVPSGEPAATTSPNVTLVHVEEVTKCAQDHQPSTLQGQVEPPKVQPRSLNQVRAEPHPVKLPSGWPQPSADSTKRWARLPTARSLGNRQEGPSNS
eukprot:2696049-Amphidinium_carterae.3